MSESRILYGVPQIAAFLGVSTTTVHNWIKTRPLFRLQLREAGTITDAHAKDGVRVYYRTTEAKMRPFMVER